MMVVLSTSNGIGSGVICDALGTKTPVAASDAANAAIVVEHGRKGMLFVYGDRMDSVRQLQRLVDDPGLLPR